jgi:hypothetical protein
VVEEPVIPDEPMPVYVEHLGPSSFPGKMRGIYGGSMWLEPSFHGLQWPYMAKSGIGVSGSIWVDSGYEQITRDISSLANTVMWLQQGRAVLRLTPTYVRGDFFIQGQVELVGNQCQQGGGTTSVCQTAGTFDTDDLWIRFGQWNKWDVKVGRFEGWEVYHTGMGLDINTMERLGAHNSGLAPPAEIGSVPDFYGVSYLQYRPAEGLGVGYIAAHLYASPVLRFELLGELGTNDITSGQGYTYLGARPTIILDLGWLKAKVAGEYETRSGDTTMTEGDTKKDSKLSRTRKGAGGSLMFVIDPTLEFGVSGAVASQHDVPFTDGRVNSINTYTRYSIGGFANMRLSGLWILGAGGNFTTQMDSFYANGSKDPNYIGHLQVFGSIQYMLARQLIMKAVIAYARADFQTSDPNTDIWSNTMLSGRVRLMYLF